MAKITRTDEGTMRGAPGVCPDCGGVIESSEGCLICRTCGYSKCG